MIQGPGGAADAPATGPHGLTPRQLEILGLVAKGLSNKDICALLGISSNTVKIHVTGILRTLNVANRTEAATAYQALVEARDAVAARARTARDVGRPTIAVLPFVNLSQVDDADYLAAGLVDDLITRLAGWRWFPVIASTSSSRYAADKQDLATVRQELGAAYVITGSVRLLGDAIRVNAHLLESEHGEGVWSGSFDARIHDVFATQDEIARRIVASLAPELMDLEGQRVPAAAEGDFGAWRLTMQGMWYLARRTPEDVARALSLFRRALESDPVFGLAWYGLAWGHHHNLIEQWTDDPATELAELGKAAGECIRLDPNGAPAQTVAGLMEMIQGNRDKAVAHLEKAANLNPSSTQALSLLGQCYGLAGRPDECIATLEDALKLNPFSPSVWVYYGVIALAHFAARRWEEAVEWANRALSVRPEMITAHLTLCASLVERGDVDEARAIIRQMRERRPDFALDDFIDLIAPSANPEYVARFRHALEAAGFGT